MECKILLIDNEQDLTLVKDSISDLSIPVAIDYADSIIAAMGMLETFMPDVIMIGSDLIIKGNGFAPILKCNSIPIIILCESYGLSRILKGSGSNVFFVLRPFELDEIPVMMKKAFDLWQLFINGRVKCTLPK